jgi:transcriptional regulator with XRE-family HTH domain
MFVRIIQKQASEFGGISQYRDYLPQPSHFIEIILGKKGIFMSESQFFNRFYQLCRKHGTSPNAVGREVGASSGSITAWKQGAMPRGNTLNKLAAYFDVTLDHLLGTHQPIGDEELKFALFGGDMPISDEMLQEVRQFAQYVKFKHQ